MEVTTTKKPAKPVKSVTAAQGKKTAKPTAPESSEEESDSEEEEAPAPAKKGKKAGMCVVRCIVW